MPLILLGLIVLICILAYSIVRYLNSAEVDTRPVRERYPHAFKKKDAPEDDGEGAAGGNDSSDEDETIYAKGFVDTDDLRGDIAHMAEILKEKAGEMSSRWGIDLDSFRRDSGDRSGDKDSDEESEKEKTIIFPKGEDVEEEKHKRNINSD